MGKTIKRGVEAFLNPEKRFSHLSALGFYHYLSDEEYLKKRWKLIMGTTLNLENPQSFNEKLQWLKLHDRNPDYIKMVDKYDAKKYVANIIGEKYIIPTLGKWANFDAIDFKKLPEQFVLKCTHDSGSTIIVDNKKNFAYKAAKRKLEKCLKRNFYWMGREWPYKDVKPYIIAEKYLVDEYSTGLKDYKLMCFNGKVRCSCVCSGRYSRTGLKVTFYDEKWEIMPFKRYYPKSVNLIKKPLNYDEMVILAEKLSKGIPFVRVDFYEVKGQIYFGELTFYPGCGFEGFTPAEWDYKLGSWIML